MLSANVLWQVSYVLMNFDLDCQNYVLN